MSKFNQINAIGYGDDFLAEFMRVSSIPVLDEPLALIEVHNALYVPGLGGLYFEDGNLIPESAFFYYRGANFGNLLKSPGIPTPGKIDPKQYVFKDIEYQILFAGILGTHYGHFITDHVSRLWPLDRLAPTTPLLFCPQSDLVFTKAYISKLFKMGGLCSQRFLKPTHPVRFRTALVPEPSLQYNQRIHICHDWFHRRVRVNMEIPNWPAPNDRVYLTRTRLGQTKWKIKNEEILEEQLSQFGYQIVAPETLSIEEQIQIFNSRATVLGSIGSSFHTTLFATSQPGKRIGVLSRAKVNNRFLLIDSLKCNNVTYFNALTSLKHQYANVRDAEIDVERSLQMLGDDGWL